MTLTLKKVVIHTDGACKGNPGVGGWGAVLQYNGKTKELCGGAPNTTNNRMELMAAIEALSALKNACEVILYTDSKYVQDGITKWLDRWVIRHWKTAANKPVKNQDLWQKLYAERQRHNIDWCWVKGHSGDTMNELADLLANKGAASVSELSKAAR